MDVHEPLDLYQKVFKEAYARNTAEYFEELVRQSGVDEAANTRTVSELQALEKEVTRAKASIERWNSLRVGVMIASLIILVVSAFRHDTLWLIGTVIAGALGWFRTTSMIRNVTTRLQEREVQRNNTLARAWQEMEPLNRLFDWHAIPGLVCKTVPRLELDPYFTNGRLDDLRNTFGLEDGFNQGRSVLYAHSGMLNGNPFVLARVLEHRIGTKTYHGSLNISWTTTVPTPTGGWKTVTKEQTLRGKIEKAVPEYYYRTFILYGNEAAPDLSFKRTPSTLSGLDDGMISNWKKRKSIRKLEAKSRDIMKESGFTVMANREFDILFGALDRDHEVQFRLLFTPLAQQEMLKLLKDKTVGYGDNFTFTKERMINIVEAEHMLETSIDQDPARFQTNDLARARTFFNDYSNNFFRSLYFGLSPLLAIPLYQQHRPHADIYRDAYSAAPCFWEHESIANYFGEEQFRHPDSITRNILKTKSQTGEDGVQHVLVTAHGYRGVKRVEHVSVYGKDGRYHDVPVEWVEYISTQHQTDMVVMGSSLRQQENEAASPKTDLTLLHEAFQADGIKARKIIHRRSIISALAPE